MEKLALALLMLALAACGGGGESASTTTQETHTITGSFTLLGTEDDPYDSDDPGSFYVEGNTCSGSGGYEDIEAGLQATVSNEAGTVIGTSSLRDGEVTDDGCRFNFSVPNVPVAKFYKIAVGRRGELSYSYDEMKSAGWNVQLTLG